jgi:hypothetical protein
MPLVDAKEFFAKQLIADEIKSYLIETAPKAYGCTPQQANDLAELHFNEFRVSDDGKIIHSKTGLYADHPHVLEFFQKNAPHLVAQRPADVSMSDRAWLEGDLTARGILVKRMGAAAAEAEAKRYGLSSLTDMRTKGARPKDVEPPKKTAKTVNPWANDPANVIPTTGKFSPDAITRQAALIKSIGAGKAAEIAAAAKSKIGATAPYRG